MAHEEQTADAEPPQPVRHKDPEAGPEQVEVATFRQVGASARVRPALLRVTLEAVQRTAGNRATSALIRRSRVLQRLKEDRYKGLDAVDAVAKALHDEEEDDAHALMGRLDKDQANKVLVTYQKAAVRCFGNKTMATACRILVGRGGSLRRALHWMDDEGSNWRLMKMVILATTDAQNRADAIEDDSLRGFFTSECGNDEMYEAVKLLGGRLGKQLAWMADEGCDDPWIWERINHTDPGSYTSVYHERLAWDRITEMSYADRAAIAKKLGGTPDEQLVLFQNDVAIWRLDWATPSADWITALRKYRKGPRDVLDICGRDPTGWAAVLRAVLADLLAPFHDVIYGKQVDAFWAAFDNGSAFSARQIMHFIGALSGREPYGGGQSVDWGQYWAVDPSDATAREFMEIIKPGGPSGPAGIAREELAKANLAFCSHEKSDGKWKLIDTSYFSDPTFGSSWIIIGVDRSGNRNTRAIGADGGTPIAVGLAEGTVPGLTFFQNHVRHEIGHAVGNKKVGKMSESGNDFALEYGSWKKSSKSSFKRSMWTDVAAPVGGWPSVAIAGSHVTLHNDDVADWCLEVLEKGKETQNAIGKAPGNVQNKLVAIKGSLWSAEKLVDYMIAIGKVDAKDFPDNAYEFPGFDPAMPDPVKIYSSRWNDDFVEYSKEALTAFKPISWYALSSPFEMFAEMYTAKYSKHRLPPKLSNGKDPAAFFAELERQRDPMFGR